MGDFVLDTYEADAVATLDLDVKGLSPEYKKQLKQLCQPFGMGEIFIEEIYSNKNPNKITITRTATKVPVKFKVVFISPRKIPYLQRINSNGNAFGSLIVPPQVQDLIDRWLKQSQGRFTNSFWSSFANDEVCRFVTDPEYLDSILLQQEVDPVAAQRAAALIWNGIKTHNKRIAIMNYNHVDTAKYMKTLRVGDKVWRSVTKFYLISGTAVMTPGTTNWTIKATDENGQPLTLDMYHFCRARLYSEQPRSYKAELSSDLF